MVAKLPNHTSMRIKREYVFKKVFESLLIFYGYRRSNVLKYALASGGTVVGKDPFMCQSPQSAISCLVDPYFQYKCKDTCSTSQALQDEVGYPELFSLPALVVLSACKLLTIYY